MNFRLYFFAFQMFPEVQGSLRLDKNNLAGKTVAIFESEDRLGAFLVHHFLQNALGSKSPVIFVGVEQSLGHYHAVGMKTGCNLIKARDSGQLHFVELLKNLGQTYGSDEDLETPNSFWHPNGKPNLVNIYKHVEDTLKGLPDNSQPPTVIIDKLSLFLAMGATPQALIIFFTHLRHLILAQGGTLILLGRRDPDHAHQETLSHFIEFRSDLVIQIWPLSTGKSPNVTGNLDYSWNFMGDQGRYQFYLDDKTVRVFALGTSKAVL